MDKLFSAANSESSIQEQIYILNNFVCSAEEVEDHEGCQLGVETWWPQIVPSLFSKQSSPFICATLNNECETPSFRGWDCATCQADILAVSTIFRDPETIKEILVYLNGDGFCGNLGLDEAGLVTCQGIMNQFMPVAIETIFAIWESGSFDICHDGFDGICQ